ncbi:hypothetical protein ACHAXT_009887 [Thalassiosira profunda]
MTTHIEAFLWDAVAQARAVTLGFLDGSDGADDYLLDHPDHWDNSAHYRNLAGGGEDEGVDATHITYEDLYASIIFFACIYVAGQIASRLLKMPSLVGEIFAGILLGPNLAGYVPHPISFAGIDIDLTTLKLIGSRGLIIAIIGSVLPIVIAMALAFAIGQDTKGKIVNTPVGQLIVSAAVIDDMIALIILSQLGALAGDASVAAIVIPIVSALGFLIIGGYVAVAVLPPFLDRFFFPKIKKEHHGSAGLGLMFLILFGMMPATYYAKSSFLLGAFLSGLVFCRNHDVHVRFVSQFKRVLQWLMRIFFAASIGFQVPIKDFRERDGDRLAVGFLVPNFNNTDRFKGLHLRDCFITGFSMAAEGEFAFVIAVFSKDQGLISADLYASIVLAVLISTIIPPFALRYTISYFNKMAERLVKRAEDMERKRAGTIDETMALSPTEQEKRMRENIEANKIIFLCIQIQCASTWGLIPKIISTLTALKLEVIDNRSWHPRGVDSTLMTEIFRRRAKTIEDRIAEVNEAMTKAIRQPGAKSQGDPLVSGALKDILAKEATKTLEGKRNAQMAATKEKTLDEIKKEMGIPLDHGPAPEDHGKASLGAPAPAATGGAGAAGPTPPTTTRRRVRQKMRSTPVTGGSLFDDPKGITPPEPKASVADTAGFQPQAFGTGLGGQSAELVVNGEVFKIRVMPETVHRIRSGYSGELLEDSSIRFSQKDVPIEHRLEGFIRTGGLQTISEDVSETASENNGSDKGSEKDAEW